MSTFGSSFKRQACSTWAVRRYSAVSADLLFRTARPRAKSNQARPAAVGRSPTVQPPPPPSPKVVCGPPPLQPPPLPPPPKIEPEPLPAPLPPEPVVGGKESLPSPVPPEPASVSCPSSWAGSVPALPPVPPPPVPPKIEPPPGSAHSPQARRCPQPSAASPHSSPRDSQVWG